MTTNLDNRKKQFDTLLPCAIDLRQLMNIEFKTRGPYLKGSPEGLVIHYTASQYASQNFVPPGFLEGVGVLDRHERSKALRGVRNVAQYMQEKGHSALLIDCFGNIFQANELSGYGYHAGLSYHMSRQNLNRHYLGVEIMCPGKLSVDGHDSEKTPEDEERVFRTHFGQAIPSENVREYEGEYYATFTYLQEVALLRLIRELKAMYPDTFTYERVVGHHEVAPKRKSDPKGSLSMSMNEYRKMLRLL